ncbi:hypothetical protein RF11_06427 [Thelohanellus kitauei]|uniref:Uncharacterized protein n=1 Tax=Thelohanellus kitauei TaxID=669202 RepID=A0A0C2MZ48_THEKT|nr:hypothetical protein RF11_06427 [Thelohanellus kitauei]
MSARQIKRLTSKQEIENDKETECEVDESRRAIFDPMAANFEIEFLEEQSDQEPDETNRESEIGNQSKQDSAAPKSKKKKKRSKKNQNSVTEPTIQQDTPNSIIESKDISNFFIINKKNFDYTIEEDILYKFIEKRAVPIKYGKYVYSQTYMETTKKFYNLCVMGNEQELSVIKIGNQIIMMENPCHVESLFRYSFLSRVRDEPLEIQKNLVGI